MNVEKMISPAGSRHATGRADQESLWESDPQLAFAVHRQTIEFAKMQLLCRYLGVC